MKNHDANFQFTQYLDRRFGIIIRIFGAMVFFVQTALYMAIVSYSPAIAIETGKVEKTLSYHAYVCMKQLNDGLTVLFVYERSSVTYY